VPVNWNPVLHRLFTDMLFAGGATAVVYSPLGQRAGDISIRRLPSLSGRQGRFRAATLLYTGWVTEELLRDLARRVEATNERVSGRV
jgi:hypothetical protein